MTAGRAAHGTARRLHGAAWVLTLTASLLACGGQDEADPATGPAGSGTDPVGGSESDTDGSTPTSTGDGDARVVVDGESYRFAFHGFTVDSGAAAINGVSEVCDPSFMGAAFMAEGYLVDDTGEVVVDNSIVAGRIRLSLPTSGHEDEVPTEVSVLIVEDAIDGEDTVGAGVTGDFTVDGSTASGRFEVPHRGASGATYDVEVDVTCPT